MEIIQSIKVVEPDRCKTRNPTKKRKQMETRDLKMNASIVETSGKAIDNNTTFNHHLKGSSIEAHFSFKYETHVKESRNNVTQDAEKEEATCVSRSSVSTCEEDNRMVNEDADQTAVYTKQDQLSSSQEGKVTDKDHHSLHKDERSEHELLITKQTGKSPSSLKGNSSLSRNSVTKSSVDCGLCHVCGKVCSSKKALATHITEKHQNPDCMKTCRECGKSFPTNWKLKQHLVVHSTVQTFSCEICNKVFPRKNALNKHVIFSHSDKSDIKWLTCPKCDKTFMYPGSFKQHVDAHQMTFRCDECEMTFSRRGSLKRHQMRHSGVKAHSCDICDHRFIQKTAYWIHMEKHHDLTKSKLQAQTSSDHSDES